VQVLPGMVDIRRVERYQLLMQLLALMRRRRRMLAEYQAMLSRVVMATEDAVSGAAVELEVSVYDRLHDQQAKRFKDAMVYHFICII